MNNKITIAILSVLAIFFLTAQTCSFGTTSSGLAADCVGEGDIVCDDTEAYECGLAAYGTGYYVSRAAESDVSECGAVDTTDTDEDGVLDADDICEGYDDAEDNDLDLTPDGCDTDDDDDGYTDRIELRAGSDPDDSSSVPETRCGTTDCGAYLCDERAAACYSSCTDGTECAEGYTCDGTACTGGATGYPTAVCSSDLTSIEKGDIINFYGSSSTDSDGTIMSYAWDFGDGRTEIDADTPHEYNDVGTYTVTLTVTDDDGNTDDCTIDITVGTTCTEATEITDCATGEVCSSASICEADSDSDGVGDDTDDICEGYDDATDTDSDSTPDGCDEDADGDEMLDSIETEVGLDPTTDELSSYELMNFDADNTDFAPVNIDADTYIEYFGPVTATIKGKATGDVATATDAEWGTVVDLTSTTSNEYVMLRNPTTTPDYWDLSTFFVIKARVKGTLSAAGAAMIVEHPLTSTANDYQFALGIVSDGTDTYYIATVENADGTTSSIIGGTPSDAEWQEVMVFNSGSTLYMYVDDVSVGTPIATSALTASTEPLFFGYKNPGDTSTSDTYDYEGYIDSVQIWGD